MYRTGDRVRYRQDGTLEFLGRTDRRISLREHLIEPGEIELALRGYPGVRDAVVILYEPVGGEPQLVAYYVAAEQSVIAAAVLKAHLQERLPSYMVPAIFMELDELPLVRTGKSVDRGALPRPSRARRSVEYVAPRTDTETVLARIWAEVLELEAVGMDENFFELGGNSLLAIRIVERARQAGLPLILRHAFEHQTIGELALALQPI
jgi:hypothetical protein